MASALIERYDDRISGVLSCYDRVVVTGTLPTVCYADGMTRFLYARQIRIFGYPEFAVTLRDKVREAAASLAAEAGVAIEHVAKSRVRKEAIVARVLARRGDHPGLVHVISAMEACDAYKPWHDKQTHKTFLLPDSGKCLHYYFYFMDAELGLVYLRVPTWSPFRLQFYCNGHSWLARRLAAKALASHWLTTPSRGSTTGNVPRNWLTRSRRTGCTACSTGMPDNAVRCSRCSGRPTTGA